MMTTYDLPPSARLLHLWPEKDLTEYVHQQTEALEAPLWEPNPDPIPHEGMVPLPNPQRLAYQSKADILGYGGAAGGGKSSLLLGLALTRHSHSAIFRRIFPNLRGLIEESKALIGDEGSYNESLHRWSMADGRVIEFEACQYEGDKEKQRGRARDFYGFDEATEFSRTQVEFIIAWNRSTNPKQRCRVVLTFNPPVEGSTSWVVEYFKPWFAYLYPSTFTHPNPAKPGELRWYAALAPSSPGLEVERVEVESGEPFLHRGQLIRPLSRSFIPARLQDNPYLSGTNYEAMLQATPEPLRSQLLWGDFTAQASSNPFQIISTLSLIEAQRRWSEAPTEAVPDCVGVDVARGGRDRTVFVPRWGHVIGEPIVYPGSVTADGPSVVSLFLQHFPDARAINVDVIGVGSAVYDGLRAVYGEAVQPVNVSAASRHTDRSGRLKMRNLRAELLWRMRDDLEAGLYNLPPSPEILADLTAPTYRILPGGSVLAEEKSQIKTRLGRSPDMGDAILLACYVPKMLSPASWSDLWSLQDEVSRERIEPFWR